MFIPIICPQKEPGRACWDNDTLYCNGFYYAMSNLTEKQDSGYAPGYAVDLHRSKDGIHWERIAKNILPLESAHAGFSFHRFGDAFYYHPTCTTAERGIHFKTYRSFDLTHWEDMGPEYDVLPDPKWYLQRWDELQVLDDQENGKPVYYGYISSEVRPEVGAPSCGLLKSYDGLSWEVLPPPVIQWGRIPSQHMEVSFCEKINGTYYLCLNGRLYLDSLGYSLFLFRGDSPKGPFYPDESMFRLCGNSNREHTWLTHTLQKENSLLCATWLSHDTDPCIPSRSFAVSPFMELKETQNHLRMAYWYGNDACKGQSLPESSWKMVHPLPTVSLPESGWQAENGRLRLTGGRDGIILVSESRFSNEDGFVLEGNIRLQENRTTIETHHHAAWTGIFFETGDREGTVMAVSTHACGATGTLRFDNHPIGSYGFVDDAYAAQDLHTGRSGPLHGLIRFSCHDWIHPIGQATAPDLRHGAVCSFRVLARGDYFQLYLNDWYVQTGVLPSSFTGRIGVIVLDGSAQIDSIRGWNMNL